MACQTVSYRYPLQRLRRLAFLTLFACREALNRKLSEQRTISRLRSLDRRHLEDFRAESFASRDQRYEAAHTTELKVGPFVAIYLPYSQVPRSRAHPGRNGSDCQRDIPLLPEGEMNPNLPFAAHTFRANGIGHVACG
jgi:hypothetical protein